MNNESNEFRDVLNKLDELRIGRGNDPSFAQRLLLEDYDGDMLADLLKPLLNLKEYSNLCFLFLTVRFAEKYYIATRAARGSDFLTKYQDNWINWTEEHSDYSPSNFFRTCETTPSNLLNNMEKWRKNAKDNGSYRGQGVETIKIEEKFLPNNVDDVQEYIYVVGPTGVSNDKKMVLSESDFTFQKFKEVYDRNEKSSRNLEIDEVMSRVAQFSDEVIFASEFPDKDGSLCQIDYFLPFFFKDKEGNAKYYGRVRFGFSKEPDEKKLQGFIERIFQLVSSLYDIDRSRKSVFSEKVFKRYNNPRQERMGLLELISKEDPENFDSEVLRTRYQDFISSVVNNDPRMAQYRDSLCLLQTTIPRGQVLRLNDGFTYDKLSYDFAPSNSEGSGSENIQSLRAYRRKQRTIGVYYALGVNNEFYNGLKDRIEEKRQVRNDRYGLVVDPDKFDLQCHHYTEQRFNHACEQICTDFKEKLPSISEFIVERTVEIREDAKKNEVAPGKNYYLVVSCNDLFNDNNHCCNESGKRENSNNPSLSADFDPYQTKLKASNYPIELGVWTCFSAMKKMEFKDASGRLGKVLVGIPFKFDANCSAGASHCYRVFAIFSPPEDFMRADGQIIDQNYFDSFYDVFYELFYELSQLHRIWLKAEKRGREIESENDMFRLLEASYQDGHALGHLMAAMLESERNIDRSIKYLSVLVSRHRNDEEIRKMKDFLDSIKPIQGTSKLDIKDVEPSCGHALGNLMGVMLESERNIDTCIKYLSVLEFQSGNDEEKQRIKDFFDSLKPIPGTSKLNFEDIKFSYKQALDHKDIFSNIREIVIATRNLDMLCYDLQEIGWARDMPRHSLRAKRGGIDPVGAWLEQGKSDWRNAKNLILSNLVCDERLYVGEQLRIQSSGLENWVVVPWATRREDDGKYRPNDFFYRGVLRELYNNVLKRNREKPEVWVDVSVSDHFNEDDPNSKPALIVSNEWAEATSTSQTWTSVEELPKQKMHVGGLLEKNLMLTSTGIGELFVRRSNGRFEVAVVLEGLQKPES